MTKSNPTIRELAERHLEKQFTEDAPTRMFDHRPGPGPMVHVASEAESLIPAANFARGWYWLIHKDLQREWRAPRIWPMMLLLGIVLALLIEMQLDLSRDVKRDVVGGLFWVAVLFAGTVSLDRSFSLESEEGCWYGLRLYPIPPAGIYLAKLAVNYIALGCLHVLLVPAFSVFSDVSLLERPLPLLLVLLVANLGFAAVGTLLSALTHGLRQRSTLLMLLAFPLGSPVMLGAAQATRSLLAGSDDWWRCLLLLVCFAAVFVPVGALMFEFVIED